MPRSRASRSVSPQKPLTPEASALIVEREKIYQNVQEMFNNTVDAEIIHMVLEECSWRGEEAIDKLLVIADDGEAQRQYKKKSQLQQIAEGVFGSLSSEDYPNHGPRRVHSNPAIPSSPLSHTDKIIRRPVKAQPDEAQGGPEHTLRTQMQSISPGILSQNLLCRGATPDASINNTHQSNETSNKVIDEIEMDLHFPRLPTKSSATVQSSESSSVSSQKSYNHAQYDTNNETLKQSVVKPNLISEAQSAYNQQYDDAAGAQKWEECKDMLSEHYVKSLSGNQFKKETCNEDQKRKLTAEMTGESGAVFCDDPAILQAHPERQQRSETSRSFPVRLLSKSPENTCPDALEVTTQGVKRTQDVPNYAREYNRLDSADLDETVLKCITEVHDDLVDQKNFGESFPLERPRSSSLPFSQGSEKGSERTGSVTPDNSLRSTPIPSNQPMTLPVIGLSVEAAEFVPRLKPSKSEEFNEVKVSKTLPTVSRSKSIEIQTGVKNVRIHSPTVPVGSPIAISPVISPALSPSSPNLNNPAAANLTGSPMFITPKWQPVFRGMSTPPPPLQPTLLQSATRYMRPHIAQSAYGLPPAGPLHNRIVYSVAPPPVFRVAGTPHLPTLRPPPPPNQMSKNLEDRAVIATGQPIMATSEASRLMSPPTAKYSGVACTAGKLVNQAVMEQYIQAIKDLHKCGRKVLIIVRGLPGSGKSTLSRTIKMDGIVLSTDDYFMRGDMYDYKPDKLPESHQWNRERAKEAIKMGTSPLIIDNTNTQRWEFKPYVSMAHNHSYHVEIIEPVTPWKFNPKECARHTVHSVPQDHIQRMLARYEHNITVDMVSNKKKTTNASGTKPVIPSHVPGGEDVVKKLEGEPDTVETGVVVKNVSDILSGSSTTPTELIDTESNHENQGGWKGQIGSPRSGSSRASSSDRYTAPLSRGSPISSSHSRSASPYTEEFLHSVAEKYTNKEPLEAASHISGQLLGFRKPIKLLDSDSSETTSTHDDASFHSCNSEVPSSLSSKDASPRNYFGSPTPMSLHLQVGKSKTYNLTSALPSNVTATTKVVCTDHKKEEDIKVAESKLDSESLQIVEDLFEEHVNQKELSDHEMKRIEEELKALLQIFMSDNEQIAAAEVLIGLKLQQDDVDKTEDSDHNDLIECTSTDVCFKPLDNGDTIEAIITGQMELNSTSGIDIEDNVEVVGNIEYIQEVEDAMDLDAAAFNSYSKMDEFSTELHESGHKAVSYSGTAVDSEIDKNVYPETDVNTGEIMSNNFAEISDNVASERNLKTSTMNVASAIELQYWGKGLKLDISEVITDEIEPTWSNETDRLDNWDETKFESETVNNEAEVTGEIKPQRKKRQKKKDKNAELEISSSSQVEKVTKLRTVNSVESDKSNEVQHNIGVDCLGQNGSENQANSNKSVELQNCALTEAFRIKEYEFDEEHGVLDDAVGTQFDQVTTKAHMIDSSNETSQFQVDFENNIEAENLIKNDSDILNIDGDNDINILDSMQQENDERTCKESSVYVEKDSVKKACSDKMSAEIQAENTTLNTASTACLNGCMREEYDEGTLEKASVSKEHNLLQDETSTFQCSKETRHENTYSVDSEIQDITVKGTDNSSLTLLKNSYSDVNDISSETQDNETVMLSNCGNTTDCEAANNSSDINENKIQDIPINENETLFKHKQNDTQEVDVLVSKEIPDSTTALSKANIEKRKKTSRRKIAAKFEGQLFNVDDKKKFLSGNWSSLPTVTDGGHQDKSEAENRITSGDTISHATVHLESGSQTESSDFAALNNLSQGSCVDTSLKYLTGRAYKILNKNINDSELNDKEIANSSKVGKILLIDKSSSTQDDLKLLTDAENVEFLKTCFPDVAEDELECVLVNCADNVEWAINLLLDWKYSLNFSKEEKQKFVDGMSEVQRTISPELVKPQVSKNDKQPNCLLDLCFDLVEKENIATREEVEKQLIQTGKERLDRIEDDNITKIRLNRSSSMNETSFSCENERSSNNDLLLRSFSVPHQLPDGWVNLESDFSNKILDNANVPEESVIGKTKFTPSTVKSKGSRIELDGEISLRTENDSSKCDILTELDNSVFAKEELHLNSAEQSKHGINKSQLDDVILEYLEPRRVKYAKENGEDTDTQQMTVDEGEDLVEEGVAPVLTLPMDSGAVAMLEEMFGPIDHRHSDERKVMVPVDHKTAWLLYQCLVNSFTDKKHMVKQQVLADEEYARQLQTQFEYEHKKNVPKTSRRAGTWSRGSTPLVGMSLQGITQQKKKTVQVKPVKPLTEIMQEEMKKQSSEEDFQKFVESEGGHVAIATRMKRQKLFEKFPDIDRAMLDDIFRANCFNLTDTEAAIVAFIGDNQPVQNVMTDEAVKKWEDRLMETTKQQSLQEMLDSYLYTPQVNKDYQDGQEPIYEDYRGEANMHHRMRHECFQKAKEAYRRGLKQVASFYSQQGHLHTKKIKEANMRASDQILAERNTDLEKNMTLDLHGLHVDEAIAALERIIPQKEIERVRGLTVITGRGSHSRGGVAKLRPSVLAYLQRHQYYFTETQTGVFRVSLKYRNPDR